MVAMRCYVTSAEGKDPMTVHAKITLAQTRRRRATAGADDVGAFVRKADLAEALEDARLNAIADERASGPFVRVSLDEL